MFIIKAYNSQNTESIISNFLERFTGSDPVFIKGFKNIWYIFLKI